MAWKFNSSIIASGFKINEFDKCVRIRDTENDLLFSLITWSMLAVMIGCIYQRNDRMHLSRSDMKDMGLIDIILWLISHIILTIFLENLVKMTPSVARTLIDISVDIQD